MNRRREVRIRESISCVVEKQDRLLRGFVRDLAPSGVFVQLEASALPSPGQEVTIRLSESGFCPELELVAVVVHRQRAPSGVTARRGIGVRLVEAPAEYHAAIEAYERAHGDLNAQVELAAPSEIEIEIDVEEEVKEEESAPLGGECVDDALGGGAVELEVQQQALEAHAQVDESDAGSALPVEGEAVLQEWGDADEPVPREPIDSADAPEVEASAPETDEADETDRANETGDEAETDDAPEPVRAATRRGSIASAESVAPRAPLQPWAGRGSAATVVYDGDGLDDVYRMLERLGAKPRRARLTGPTRFEGWEQPPRVLIVEARSALSIEVPENSARAGVTCIAISDSDSEVLGTLLGRLGYHYLIRRPIHSEVLRVLLAHVLNRGVDERRAHPRQPLGIPARLAFGWRRSACTLVDLSEGGCRIVTREDLPMLALVRLRVAKRESGSRALSPRGCVVRRRELEGGEWAIAIRFDELGEKQRATVARMLARRSIGPAPQLTSLPLDRIEGLLERVRGLLGSWRGWHAALGASEHPESDVEAALAPAPEERRAVPRVVLEQEVVALDETRSHAQAGLVGRDLSIHGMRVDPHPELGLTERLTVALYMPGVTEPVVVDAEVTRDDGERGVALHFLDVSEDAADRIARLIQTLPAVETLLGESPPEGLFLGRIEPTRLPASEAEAPAPAEEP